MAPERGRDGFRGRGRPRGQPGPPGPVGALLRQQVVDVERPTDDSMDSSPHHHKSNLNKGSLTVHTVWFIGDILILFQFFKAFKATRTSY